jgi:hypothetical protein
MECPFLFIFLRENRVSVVQLRKPIFFLVFLAAARFRFFFTEGFS